MNIPVVFRNMPHKAARGFVSTVAFAGKRGGRCMSERWLSMDEIAIHLGVSEDTIHRWIRQKEMPAHKVGRLWKFDKDDVDAWVRSGISSSGSAEESE